VRSFTSAIAILGLVLNGCSEAPGAPTSAHADSAGVDMATYSGADLPLGWSFQKRFVLGGEEKEGESFYQVSAKLVHADSSGNLYVLDRESYRVLVFDSSGSFLRAMGREGGGPGEFKLTLSFTVSKDGTSALFDLGKRSLVRFGADGGLLPELPFPAQYFGGSIHLDGDALIVPVQTRNDEGVMSELRRLTPADTSVLAAVAFPPGKPIQLESCGMSFSGMGPLFSPTLRWAAHGNTVALATSDAYEVRVFRDITPVRSIRRSLRPITATREAAVRELGEGMRVRTERGVVTCAPDEVVEQRGFAAVIPAIARIEIDPEGRLWVERGHVADDDAPIDLYDAAGEYLGTLPSGTPFPVTFLSASRPATITTDELDVTRVAVYELVVESGWR
jgi:hypothetical protein